MLNNLSEDERNDISIAVLVTIKMQSALHDLDKIKGETSTLKANQKKEFKAFISYMENFAKRMESTLFEFCATFMDGEQSQNYGDCVELFDQLGESINVK